MLAPATWGSDAGGWTPVWVHSQQICIWLELTQGGKFRHCVKIFWLQRELKMLCIKILDSYPLGWFYLFLKSLCGTREDLACQRCAGVWFWGDLVQIGINRVTLGSITVGSWGGWNSKAQAALCNACGAVSELVHGMPGSYGFSVPGNRGISLSCFNPVLFYWIIYYLRVMGKVDSCCKRKAVRHYRANACF